MEYFANESDCMTLPDGLVIENRLDRVRFGDVDITCDQGGLALAGSMIAKRAARSTVSHSSDPRSSSGGRADDAQLIELRAIHAVLSLRALAGQLPAEVPINAPQPCASVFGLQAPVFARDRDR